MEIEFKCFDDLRESLNDLNSKMSRPTENDIPHVNHDGLQSYVRNVQVNIERCYKVSGKIQEIEKSIREIFQIGRDIGIDG